MSTDNNLLLDYIEFVDEVSSDATKHTDDFIDSIEVVEENGVDPSRLLTASIGLSGETGEFNDIVKKCIFQGKEMDEDTVTKLKSELGDVMWYIAQGCIALNTDIEELIDINTAKLEKRYPGGFDEFRSDNRDEDDI
tara:strand:+ start:2787 stop:3197 length:411 start_codon:yes stop_codon:yes gene_type:complete